VWGEVVEGLDIAERLAAGPSTNKGGMSMLNTPVVFTASLA
jgi:hypothetical protein